MRILVLNQHYWPEIAATAQILTDLCEDLAAAGHEVVVLCGQPSYRQIDRATSLPARETHGGVQIRRVWTYKPARRSIVQRLGHYASYFGTSLAAAMREARPDVVLVLSTPPLLLGLSGVLQKTLRGVPFVYSVQDLYPDIAMDLGVISPGPLASSIDLVSRALYASASQVVTLSAEMAARLTAKGVATSRLHVVPNWADTAAVRPLPRDNEFARAHGLVGRFVVQYSGNVGMSQGLEHLVSAASMVADLPVEFVVVGEGNGLEALKNTVSSHRVDNVRFLPPQPRDRLPELLASADVGLVPMKRGVGGNLVPSKLYGILAAARPVLASVDDETEVARVVRKFGCGQVVAPENPSALAEGVRSLFGMGERLADMGNAGRLACEGQFSRRVCTAAYDEVLRAAV